MVLILTLASNSPALDYEAVWTLLVRFQEPCFLVAWADIEDLLGRDPHGKVHLLRCWPGPQCRHVPDSCRGVSGHCVLGDSPISCYRFGCCDSFFGVSTTVTGHAVQKRELRLN